MENRTITVRHESWTGLGPFDVKIVAWRVTVGPIPPYKQGAPLALINGVEYPAGAIIRLGGSDTFPVLMWSANVQNAQRIPVTIETLEPNIR